MSGETHPEHHAGGTPHGSLRGYLTGFLLSVVLTAIPFWLVMAHVLGNATATALAIMVLAAMQVVVHMVYFLHMDTRAEGGWTIMALMFTIVLLVITLSGSLWVMFHLNANMMPEGMSMTMPDGMPGAMPDSLPPGSITAPMRPPNHSAP